MASRNGLRFRRKTKGAIAIQARVAIQGGLRKVNARERFALGELNNDVQERRRDQMSSSSDSSRPSREYIDAQKGISRSHYASDDEESAKIMSASVPLSVLLIPSLKEVNPNTDFILICVMACSCSKLVCDAK